MPRVHRSRTMSRAPLSGPRFGTSVTEDFDDRVSSLAESVCTEMGEGARGQGRTHEAVQGALQGGPKMAQNRLPKARVCHALKRSIGTWFAR